jgi:hypothetical protein
MPLPKNHSDGLFIVDRATAKAATLPTVRG